MTERSDAPSKRQIIFNWLMDEDDFATKKDGYCGGTEEVAHADALIAALSAVSETAPSALCVVESSNRTRGYAENIVKNFRKATWPDVIEVAEAYLRLSERSKP